MGVFRNYFNMLYGTYLKKPIDGVKGSLVSLRDIIGEKIGLIDETLIQFGNKMVTTGTGIVTGIVAGMKENANALVGALAAVAAPLTEMVTGVIQVGNNKLREIMIWRLKDAADVTSLNAAWKSTPGPWKEDKVVSEFYQAEKEKLEDQGLDTPTDVVLGYMGKQVAAAIWAVEERALPNIMEWIDSFAAGYKMKKEDIASMKELANAGEFGLNAVVNFMLGVTLYPAVMSAGEPAWMMMKQEAYKALPTALLDPRSLVSLWYKDMIGHDEYIDQFKRQGFDRKNIDFLEKDFLFYPNPQDFIRFAVRETFKPKVVADYGYDMDFPTEMLPYANRAGMSEEWLKHYWRAHWEIPSPRQGYEMLHRGVIDKGGLETLLKIGDYAPGWVQPLIDISYSPITRVDLRRLFRDGTIDEERVLRGYSDLGYSDENAELMTAWTVQDCSVDERELTKAEVLKSFRIGDTSKDQAIKFLGNIGYTVENAEFVVAYEEYKLTEEDRKEEIETVIAELIEGKYTVEEVRGKLKSMDISTRQSNQLIQKAERVIRKRFVIPSKSDCMKWFKKGIIDEKMFQQKMRALYYVDDDIERYKEEVMAEK